MFLVELVAFIVILACFTTWGIIHDKVVENKRVLPALDSQKTTRDLGLHLAEKTEDNEVWRGHLQDRDAELVISQRIPDERRGRHLDRHCTLRIAIGPLPVELQAFRKNSGRPAPEPPQIETGDELIDSRLAIHGPDELAVRRALGPGVMKVLGQLARESATLTQRELTVSRVIHFLAPDRELRALMRTAYTLATSLEEALELDRGPRLLSDDSLMSPPARTEGITQWLPTPRVGIHRTLLAGTELLRIEGNAFYLATRSDPRGIDLACSFTVHLSVDGETLILQIRQQQSRRWIELALCAPLPEASSLPNGIPRRALRSAKEMRWPDMELVLGVTRGAMLTQGVERWT